MNSTFTGKYITNIFLEIIQQLRTSHGYQTEGTLEILQDHILVKFGTKNTVLQKSDIQIREKFYNRFRILHNDLNLPKYLVFSMNGVSKEISQMLNNYGYKMV